MQIGPHRFNRMELAGSLGDLGTLVPMAVGLMVVCGLGATPVLLMIGVYYIAGGVYFKLPIPVQPLKVVSALALASPALATVPVLAATGMIFGVVLIVLAYSGSIDKIAALFTPPIVRGIQLGLGFILMTKGIAFIAAPGLFLPTMAAYAEPTLAGLPLNTVVGVAGAMLGLMLLSNRQAPAALALVAGGIAFGVAMGALRSVPITLGPTPIELQSPSTSDYMTALVLFVIPQIPLTLGNAVMGTTDTCCTLFGPGEKTRRCTNRRFSASMGFVNVAAGLIGAMPMCHGAGGLAAHYRFGARTGGSNIMIGAVFVILALLFGQMAIGLLGAMPQAILGVLLLYAGLELALLVRDVTEKRDLFVAFLIAGIGLATVNMALAFGCGMLAQWIIRAARVEV